MHFLFISCVILTSTLVGSGKTSRQARDIHLLKTIKTALRTKPADHILSLVKEVKTSTIKIQLVNVLVNSKYLTVNLAKDILEELSGKERSTETQEMNVGKC